MDNREPLDAGTLERVCSFLRVGSDPEQAALAAGIPFDAVTAWLAENEYWIRRAQAQFVVLACNRMMTDGGSAGARYLLERYAPAFAIAEEAAEEHDGEEGITEWDDLDLD